MSDAKKSPAIIDTVLLIETARIQVPPMYVRGQNTDPKNLAKLQNVVAEAFEGVADADKGWPFRDPLIVRQIPKTPEGAEFQIVDGVHRFTVAVSNGWAKVPCVVKTYANEGEAFMDQLRLNMAHGLSISKEHRDAAIMMLVNVYKKPLADVVAVLGGALSVSSVSRIAAGTQRVGETGARAAAQTGKVGRKKGKKKKGGKDATVVSPGDMTTEQWYSALDMLLSAFRLKGGYIVGARGMVKPDTLEGAARMMAAIYENHTPEQFHPLIRPLPPISADKAVATNNAAVVPAATPEVKK